jgi:imidazole glycerol-phosphate synthase subunit HisH
MTNYIAIIDYGLGNIFSIENSLNELGYKCKVSANKDILSNAAALILPGVGAFDVAMENINKNNLKDIIIDLAGNQKKPIIGICLGMQLLATNSEENGFHQGLGLIEGTVKKIVLPHEYKVPHVGWNVVLNNIESQIYKRVPKNSNYYFDHSYHFECNPEHISGIVNYGIQLTASVEKDNIYGVQFHPEKSQVNGLKLFRSFFSKYIS